MAGTGSGPALAPPTQVRALGPWRAAAAQARTTLRILAADRSAVVGMVVIGAFVLVALLAPWIAPYGPFEVAYASDGGVARLSPPSASNPFGTTNQGMDVFSQLVWGTRVALLVGLVVTVSSAYAPARRAAKVPPVEAMRSEFASAGDSLRLPVIPGN